MLSSDISKARLEANLERSKALYTSSHAWFYGAELRARIFEFMDPLECHHILEIGSYEGLSACFFSDELLRHPDSRLVCVDPFSSNDTTTDVTSEVEAIFFRNISKSRNYEKVRVYKMESDEYFTNKDAANQFFDFVYIDGSHVLEQIIRDIENSFQHLRVGGILWLDDYRGTQELYMAFHRYFSTCKLPLIKIHEGYQLAFRKLN